jgi:hypothetical protein
MRTKYDMVWRRRSEERRHREGEWEETSPDGLIQILLSKKLNKIHGVDSVATNGQ